MRRLSLLIAASLLSLSTTGCANPKVGGVPASVLVPNNSAGLAVTGLAVGAIVAGASSGDGPSCSDDDDSDECKALRRREVDQPAPAPAPVR